MAVIPGLCDGRVLPFGVDTVGAVEQDHLPVHRVIWSTSQAGQCEPWKVLAADDFKSVNRGRRGESVQSTEPFSQKCAQS